MKLKLSYYKDTDTLSLWNGMPASEGGDLIATGELIVDDDKDSIVPVDIIADYDSEGKVVGFTIEHAAGLLLHSLVRKGTPSDYFEVDGLYSGYRYTLSLNKGTLSLSSGREQVRSDEVAEHLTAHYDTDGDAAGFTLERAAELLLPLLNVNGEDASQWIPPVCTGAGSASAGMTK